MIDIEKNYSDTLEKIINGNFQDYIKFVTFASRGNIYNYSFADQVRIFQMKPETKMVAPYEMWRNIGRTPKFRTGIHINVADKFVGELYKNINSKFNGCVFALEDTVGNSFDSKIVNTLNKDEIDYITEKLNKSVDSQKDFNNSIKTLTQTGVRYIISSETDKNLFEFICDITMYSIYNRFNLEYRISQSSMEYYDRLSVEERKEVLEYSQPYIQEISRKSIKFIHSVHIFL